VAGAVPLEDPQVRGHDGVAGAMSTANGDAGRVHTELSAGVATITLANVASRNSVDIPFATEILAHVQAAAGRPDIGVILVRAEGPAWCVGGALDVFRDSGENVHDYITEIGGSINPLVAALHECDKITIAAVHGAVGGGGLGLMLAHDIVIAAEGTVMVLGYSRIGSSPDAGTSYFLTREIGYRAALQLYLDNERIDATRALELGMVNQVVAPTDLCDVATAHAASIAAGPRRAQATTKRLFRQAYDGLLARQLDDEIRTFADNTRDADFAEGIRSFLEKRPPRFGAGAEVAAG
jgi:2-(1,2-epoxy-1,2-dihydrophenyl)acetyl-CoA isomerase